MKKETCSQNTLFYLERRRTEVIFTSTFLPLSIYLLSIVLYSVDLLVMIIIMLFVQFPSLISLSSPYFSLSLSRTLYSLLLLYLGSLTVLSIFFSLSLSLVHFTYLSLVFSEIEKGSQFLVSTSFKKFLVLSLSGTVSINDPFEWIQD